MVGAVGMTLKMVEVLQSMMYRNTDNPWYVFGKVRA